MKSFSQIDALCRLPGAFQFGEERDALFLEAMRENYLFQFQEHPFVRALAERAGFSPADLQCPEDVFRIPPLFVGTMKLNRFCTVPDDAIALNLTSSGTSGQKTQLVLDSPSLERLQRLARTICLDTGFTSDTSAHYLLFSYERKHAHEVGTSWSDEQLMANAPALSEHWLIRWDGEQDRFAFDAAAAARWIVDLSSSAPLRLLGFPAFMFQAAEEVRRIKPGLRLHPGSFIIAGGGWKSHSGEPMTHTRFSQAMETTLGIPRENVRDQFGMAEHGIPYNGCRLGNYHVPIFSRVTVRDPLTMEPKGYGKEGLLHLLTPYNTAQPNCSILTTDIAILGQGCTCGIAGDFMVTVRRGGTHQHKGCAVAAQEILDRIRRLDKV